MIASSNNNNFVYTDLMRSQFWVMLGGRNMCIVSEKMWYKVISVCWPCIVIQNVAFLMTEDACNGCDKYTAELGFDGG
jgi:hypothetical protein